MSCNISDEDVEKELALHDELDLVLVLAIGLRPASHSVIQKRAMLICKLLGIDPVFPSSPDPPENPEPAEKYK
jgi:hypothetical protein